MRRSAGDAASSEGYHDNGTPRTRPSTRQIVSFPRFVLTALTFALVPFMPCFQEKFAVIAGELKACTDFGRLQPSTPSERDILEPNLHRTRSMIDVDVRR